VRVRVTNIDEQNHSGKRCHALCQV